MKIELNKKYLMKCGTIVTITKSSPAEQYFLGEYEDTFWLFNINGLDITREYTNLNLIKEYQEYRPFTDEEIFQLIGRNVFHYKSNEEFYIIGVLQTCSNPEYKFVNLSSKRNHEVTNVSKERFLDKFVFGNGEPCGKKNDLK